MPAKTQLTLSDGVSVPVHRLNTVILGSGAAGMNCAVHLFEFMTGKGVDRPQDRIAVVTAGIGLGASRMSGSDKQTYYKQGTSPEVADSAVDFAGTLTANGCMHGDVALAEGESSLREFFHLVQAGVPFPHDPEGAYVGYKTDHDPYERATSAGPKTSRYMSECLEAQAKRYGVKTFDKHEAVGFLTRGAGADRRIVGLATIDKRRLGEPGFGLTLFLAENFVLAAGGPGALYEVSVYPLGQVGVHGLAFKAGLGAHNMTEWQFGLASTKFRWNVSGTYMQVAPRLFSTNRRGGDAREFLAPHFPTMSGMATDIFLKGYQWPFDAQRVLNKQSSLIDMLVTHETRALGRRVFMDFLQNPAAAPNMRPFALDELAPEALTYLQRNGALQPTPIERLRHMNPLAIDIYSENGIDIAKEPLEINVCSQHHNGGFIVDKWWQSTVAHTFVIGEMAGTHGVKRPGGSALNSGQAGGLRAAEYIVNVYGPEIAPEGILGDEQKSQLEQALANLKRLAAGSSEARPAKAILTEIQKRGTAAAGHVRELKSAEQALTEARNLLAEIRRAGVAIKRASELPLAVQVEHLALTQVALLEAVGDYLKRDGGSRGSFMVLRDDGTPIDADISDPRTGSPYRFIEENKSLRQEIAEIRLADEERAGFVFARTAPRPMPKRSEAFEKMWTAYRHGDIFGM